jgi:hypothetical protein
MRSEPYLSGQSNSGVCLQNEIGIIQDLVRAPDYFNRSVHQEMLGQNHFSISRQ